MARNKNDIEADGGDPNARLETSSEDREKAGKWFERARELGGKRQFDYAIEYYVNGLEFWPDAVEEALKPLHGCAVARRQTGGKKPGLKDTMKRSLNDKDPQKAFMNALWLFGHDPDNLSYLDGVGRNANRLHADDAARWSLGLLLKALDSAPKLAPKQIHAVVATLEEMGDRANARGEPAYAIDVYQMAIAALDVLRRRFPKDDSVETMVKNLSSKMTILKGKYTEGDYRSSIQDLDEQADLHDEHRSVQSEERVDELIAKAEAAYRHDPSSGTALKNLVDMLCRREKDADETKAVGLLVEAYDGGGDYRWKQLADDIRMKQLGRRLRQIRKEGEVDKIKQQRIAQLRFELGVYRERLERYPTDNRVKFEYAVRNFDAGRFDEAIPLLQAARVDPRNKSMCGMYLGRCFYRKGFYDQAIPALEEAISQHSVGDDDLAKTMQYWLGRSQEAARNLADARKTYGKILQLDYNFADVRARMEGLPQDA